MFQKSEDAEDESVLNAILIASIAGIIIVVGLIIFYPRPSENFTAIYFGNYTKTPANGNVLFDFTVENHENKDMAYNVTYKINNSTVSVEKLSVKNGGNATLSRTLSINGISKAKVQVLVNSDEIHFWTV